MKRLRLCLCLTAVLAAPRAFAEERAATADEARAFVPRVDKGHYSENRRNLR